MYDDVSFFFCMIKMSEVFYDLKNVRLLILEFKEKFKCHFVCKISVKDVWWRFFFCMIKMSEVFYDLKNVRF